MLASAQLLLRVVGAGLEKGVDVLRGACSVCVCGGGDVLWNNRFLWS